MSEETLNDADEQPISLEGGDDDEEESISLVEPSDESRKDMRTFGASAVAVHEKKQFKRPLNLTGKGATRCRIFRSKIAATPLEYMEEQINDWLDGEEIEVKHVGQVIGILEGKRSEPNMLVMVWY